MGRHSHSDSPSYSSPLSDNSGLHPLGGFCHSSRFGRQNRHNYCGFLLFSHPLIEADLTACFGGGLPDLVAGELSAKHVD